MLAEALALTGLAGGPLGLSLAAGSYMSGSRVARTRPELVATWCDGNPALVDALDDVIARLTASARPRSPRDESVFRLAAAGHSARMNWEHRRFEPVELARRATRLRAHGRAGGWITAVLRDEDGDRLLGHAAGLTDRERQIGAMWQIVGLFVIGLLAGSLARLS